MGLDNGIAAGRSVWIPHDAETPVVTAAAIISLALGIGANTAFVSLMDVVLWRDLPVPNPTQLMLVHWSGRGFPKELA